MTTINITLLGYTPVFYGLLMLICFFLIGFCGHLAVDAVINYISKRKKEKENER